MAVVEPVAARAHATSAEKVMSTLTRVGVEEGDVGAGDGSDDGGSEDGGGGGASAACGSASAAHGGAEVEGCAEVEG